MKGLGAQSDSDQVKAACGSKAPGPAAFSTTPLRGQCRPAALFPLSPDSRLGYLLVMGTSFKKGFYLLTCTEMRREREKGGEKHQCERDPWISRLSHAATQNTSPQPSHVSQLGIKPATFWFTGLRSVHRATLARAWALFF